MNKFLLLALMLLLAVLAFALGLFSKGSSTALSQYVPDSVGEMFSKTKNHLPTQLNNKQENKKHTAIATLVMPDASNTGQAVPTKDLEISNKNTISKTESTKATFIEIPVTLMAELQQGLSPELSPEALASIKQSVNEIESENQALKEKLISLNAKSNEHDSVLEELEMQIKDKLASQKPQLNDRDNLLKELEIQIQDLNN